MGSSRGSRHTPEWQQLQSLLIPEMIGFLEGVTSHSPNDFSAAYRTLMDTILTSIAEAGGASIFCAVSLLSGLGTDAILSVKGSSAQKGRGRGKGKSKGLPSGRDVATSIADGSRFLNQLSVTDPEAKELIAQMITGCPSFSKERALAVLWEIFPCACITELADDSTEGSCLSHARGIHPMDAVVLRVGKIKVHAVRRDGFLLIPLETVGNFGELEEAPQPSSPTPPPQAGTPPSGGPTPDHRST